MVLTMKQMNYLMQMNAIKEFGTSFSSFILHAVNLLLSNHTLTHSFQTPYIKHTKHPPKDQDVPLKERIERGSGSPYKPKSLNFPHLLDINPHQNIEYSRLSPDHQTLYWRKVYLTAFRQFLPKMLPACIFSYIIMTYLKSLVGTKSLYPLSAFLTKNVHSRHIYIYIYIYIYVYIIHIQYIYTIYNIYTYIDR